MQLVSPTTPGSIPVPEQLDLQQEWLGHQGMKNVIVDASHQIYSWMGILHVLRVVLHSSLKGDRC